MNADPVEREALLTQSDPFYFPPYVGSKARVDIQLDHAQTDWDEVAELIAISYCLIAPRRLAEKVTGPPSLDRSI